MNNEFLEFVKEFEKKLKEYNKVHNITRLKDIIKEANDSILVCDFCKFDDNKTIADIGSGAGFPAIFLAFLNPKCNFYLFEPSYKKSAFLFIVKTYFSLNNVNILTKKVECESGIKADIITSRAFAKTDTIVKLCDNISNLDTKFIFYKGSFVKNELDCLNDYELFEYKSRIFLQFFKKNCKYVTD